MEEEGGGIKVDGVIHRYLVEKKKIKKRVEKGGCNNTVQA